MFRKSVTAAVLVAGAALLPGAALAATAYTVGSAELRAGPDYDYPTVRVINDGRRVEVFGCLEDWSFCDVGYRSDRGWVAGEDLVVDYRNGRTRIVQAAPYIGIGVLSFNFDTYWDSYYRGRPFYSQRSRWERHYVDHYQAHWGPRPDHHDGNNGDHHDNNGNRHDNNQQGNDRHDNNTPAYRGKPYNAPAQPMAAPTPAPQPKAGVTTTNPRGDNDHRGDANRPGNMGDNNAMHGPGNMQGQGAAEHHELPHTPQQGPTGNPAPTAHQNNPPGGGEHHAPAHDDKGQKPKHDRDEDNQPGH